MLFARLALIASLPLIAAAGCGDRTALLPEGATTATGTGGHRTQSGGGAGAGGASGSSPQGGAGGLGAGGKGSTGGGTTGSGGNAGPGGSAGSGGAGSGGMTGTPKCAPRVLLQGTQRLIDMFVIDSGVIVVSSDAALLVGRDGAVIKSVPLAREITAAAFDGTTLVVADRAELTVLTRELALGPSAILTEACAAAVLVSGGRFVCGPANDWDRIFYTYDVGVTPPVARASSKPYTYNGTPMRRVPGTDDFITVSTDLSPSDFHLYRVGADGAATYLNESPYHGDFAVTMTFAFDGTPPVHVIQPAGLLLRIYSDTCDSTTSSFTTGCFVKDGALGTLRGQDTFIGLGDNAAGTVFAVVSSGYSYSSSACSSGCAFQRIDAPSRTVVSQQSHPVMNLQSIVRTVGDPVCDQIILGYTIPDPKASYNPGGFRIETFSY
jgi:hypothetical protein